MNSSLSPEVQNLVPPTVVTVPPAPAAAAQGVRSVAQIEHTANEAAELIDLLSSEDYDVEPLAFRLPPGFLLSLVIPVYNEERTIATILARVAALPIPKEIIVVDDCSCDGTRDVLRNLESARDLQIIFKPRNEGKGAALHTAFAVARGDVVVVQDADLEYDPRDIPALLRPIVEDGADVVYGSRFLDDVPQDPSATHRWGNRLLTTCSNLTTGLRLTDMETCYKAFRRSLLGQIKLCQQRFGFEPEITAKLARRGCRFLEVPVRYRARGYGEGKKIGWRDALNAFYCIARYGWRD
jgi:glycosyltransferase involved in cell wall biosynthesis